jgi:transcriptional regulator with XRE-family HTH domain
MAKKGVVRLLGAEIRKRREALGLSQEELAGKAGVHVNVVGRLERGVYNPTVLLLQAIAAALKANLSELFSSIGE